MFWIGFLIGILALPALAAFVWFVLFLIDAIPYAIKCIRDYFELKTAKKLLSKEVKKLAPAKKAKVAF